LEALKRGETIAVPVYNHETGDFDPPKEFKPSPIIIVEGLFALYPQFLPYLDFSIYVDPSREVKWLWKKRRDTADRGHDAQELEKEMLARESAYKRWIDFQKTSATIVVKIFPTQIASMARYEFTGTVSDECFKIELLVEPATNPLPSLMLPFDLAMITDIHTPPFLLASVPGKYWGRDILTIHIDGELSQETIRALSTHIESYTGNQLSDVQHSSVERLDPIPTTRFAQLLIAWRFLELVHQKLEEQ
jgi:phosphoribulokinase